MNIQHRMILCGLLSIAAASASGAVLTEDFQDGNITADPAWSLLDSSTCSVVSTSGNYYLRFTTDNSRLTSAISAIAPGSIITLSFKTMKGTGGNNIAVGFLDSSGAGILIASDLNTSANPANNSNRVAVTSTVDYGAHTSGSQSLTNVYDLSNAGASVWHSLQVTWNTGTGAISAVIDGFSAGSATMTSTIRTTNITQILIKNAYANSAYIDDISISVPEPASAAVLGLGGLAMLWRRR